MKPLGSKVELFQPHPTVDFLHEKTQVVFCDVQLLNIGGCEGLKYRAKAIINGKLCNLFIKELKYHHSFEFNQIEDAIRSSMLLKKHGFLVPDIIKYFYHNETIYVVMSDLSENGEYYLWGFSDLMTKEQKQELLDMKLTKNQVSQIEKRVVSISNRASRKKIKLSFNYYHVRKHKKTGKIDICFLDIDPIDIYEDKTFIKKNNKKEADFFIRMFRKNLK